MFMLPSRFRRSHPRRWPRERTAVLWSALALLAPLSFVAIDASPAIGSPSYAALAAPVPANPSASGRDPNDYSGMIRIAGATAVTYTSTGNNYSWGDSDAVDAIWRYVVAPDGAPERLEISGRVEQTNWSTVEGEYGCSNTTQTVSNAVGAYGSPIGTPAASGDPYTLGIGGNVQPIDEQIGNGCDGFSFNSPHYFVGGGVLYQAHLVNWLQSHVDHALDATGGQTIDLRVTAGVDEYCTTTTSCRGDTGGWIETLEGGYQVAIRLTNQCDYDSDGIPDPSDATPTELTPIDVDGTKPPGDSLCHVQPPTFAWEVLPRSEGVNGNLTYDEGKWSEPLPETKTFMVDFNGCNNGGTTQFTIDGVQMEPDCDLTWPLSEGPHEVTVAVLDGPSAGTTTETIDVVHHLVVGLGDSFGSGESAGAGYEWDDANCRRAGWSAQARAAVALEQQSPHSTVTFLHLACSGATVNKGVLGPYPEPPGGKKVTKSQVRQAADLTAGYVIDALLLSVGGNDIGFANVLKSCGQIRNCPLAKERFRLQGPKRSDVMLHAEVQDDLAELPGRYHLVARCLTGPGVCPASDWDEDGNLAVGAVDDEDVVGDPSKVLISEYPDLATRMGSDGMLSPEGYTYCTRALKWLSWEPGFSGIQDEEFAWAREVVQRGVKGVAFAYSKDVKRGDDKMVRLPVSSDGLNSFIATGPFGWTPVTGTFDAFGGHGYCAEKAWVTPMKRGYILGTNSTAPFHPNRLGYQKWGVIIGERLTTTLPVPPA